MTTVEQLTQALKLGDEATRAAAAEQLSRLGGDAQPAIPALVQGAGANDEALREWCVAALEEVGPPAHEQIADLMALAQAADESVAYWGITLLGRGGAACESAVPVLIDRLGDRNAAAVQQRAAWALGEIGHGNAQATAVLQAVAAGQGPAAPHARQALSRLAAA